MLTPEEKERIVERIRFEEQLRKELADSGRSAPSKWNSKIRLLLVGSLMTGVLVPCFQFFQSKLEWHRQNAFEHTQFRLTTARDCLREFAAVQAYAPEILDRVRVLGETMPVQPDEAEQLLQDYVQLRAKLGQQSAKVMSLIMYFDEAEAIRTAYQHQVALLSNMLNEARTLFGSACRASTADNRMNDLQEQITKVTILIEADTDKVNQLYTEIINAMRTEIGRLEDERSRFL